MTNRLFNPQALEVYIRHTVDSVPMRELAHRYCLEPSTILRQIRRVEEQRDNPDWSLVLNKLAEHWNRKDEISQDVLYDALGVTTFDVITEMQGAILLLVQDGALVGITDGCMAGIFVDNEIMRRTERHITLAWMAVGWLVLARSSSRVRRYKVTDRAFEEIPQTPIVPEKDLSPTTPRPRTKPKAATSQRYTRQAWCNEPIDKLRLIQRRSKNGLKMAEADIQTAEAIRNLMHQASLDGKGSSTLMLVIELENRLGKEMFDLLYDFLHRNRGIEQIEKDFSWPARSAKVVLLIALKQVRHFGLLDRQEPAIAAE